MMEQWRRYAEEDRYEVSDLGRVRNLETGRFLAGTVRKDGYVQVRLGTKLWMLHGLVMHVWEGPLPPGKQACHENGVRTDCKLSNLRYDTPAGNGADRVRHLRERKESYPSAVLTEDRVLAICRRLDAGDKLTAIAADFSVGVPTISVINRGGSWSWLTGRKPNKGRLPTHHNHARKLSREAALDIDSRLKAGEALRSIAAVYGIRHQTVQQIAKGKCWGHVTGRTA